MPQNLLTQFGRVLDFLILRVSFSAGQCRVANTLQCGSMQKSTLVKCSQITCIAVQLNAGNLLQYSAAQTVHLNTLQAVEDSAAHHITGKCDRDNFSSVKTVQFSYLAVSIFM